MLKGSSRSPGHNNVESNTYGHFKITSSNEISWTNSSSEHMGCETQRLELSVLDRLDHATHSAVEGSCWCLGTGCSEHDVKPLCSIKL